MRNSEFARARKSLESWPPALRGTRNSQSLEVALLRAEGKEHEALELMRHILEADPREVESRIKLDQMNLSAPFDDLRDAARRDLWDLVAQIPDAAPNALLVLAQAPGLSLREASDISAQLTGKSFEKLERRRHDILDGCLTAFPELVASVLDQEEKLTKGRTLEENEEYFRWLGTHGQSRQVLAQLSEKEDLQSNAATLFEDGGSKRLTPLAVVLRSVGLFTTYASCLENEQKWVDLARLLRREGLPFSRAKLELMRGMCSHGMGAGDAIVEEHLSAGLLYASKTQSAEDLAMVVAIAERLNCLPIAVKACEFQVQDPAIRLDVLKKEYSLQQEMRDADGMLRTSLALVELRPGLRPFEEQTHYLRLLTGQELELEIQRSMEVAIDSAKGITPSQSVCAALAAYMIGDKEGARAWLRRIDIAELKHAGLRAVTAGLLAETGDAERAYAVAEQISARSTLLPEEQWFLQQALR